jgi:hypothetical protein
MVNTALQTAGNIMSMVDKYEMAKSMIDHEKWTSKANYKHKLKLTNAQLKANEGLAKAAEQHNKLATEAAEVETALNVVKAEQREAKRTRDYAKNKRLSAFKRALSSRRSRPNGTPAIGV